MSHYTLNTYSLAFQDPGVETIYRDETLTRTLWFCRAAWALLPILGGGFAVLDPIMFGPRAPMVLVVRVFLVLIGIAVIAASFIARMRALFVFSSALYIMLTGSFCAFLVALDRPDSMSIYFLGLFISYATIYSTVGIGFRYSLMSLLGTSALFLFITGIIIPVTGKVLLIYTVFLAGVVLVFAYSAYLIERIARERFSTAAQLRQSLADIRTLSGLLPICANCKKVRDDQGYWSQIETYISDHSDATFSHGLCPTCTEELYPDLQR